MPRPTLIDKLEPELRAEINRLRTDKGYGIDQIVEYLKGMDVCVSRATVGRHVKKLAEVGARIREARAVAEGLAPTLTDKDDGELLNVNVQLLHSAVMQIMSATGDDGEDVTIAAKDAMAIGRALECSAKAQKISADRILKIRKETAEAAAKTVETSLKKEAPGLSADTVAKIRKQVLGVAE